MSHQLQHDGQSLPLNPRAVLRPLKMLVPLIKQDIEQGNRLTSKGMEFYRAAGEKLLEARRQVSHGMWEDWLRENFGIARSTAWEWMQISKCSPGERFETIKDFRRKTRPSRTAGLDEIRRIMREGIRVKIIEKKKVDMVRDLKIQIIKAGYHALSLKLHPDKGGSDEAMRLLIEARDSLRGAI